jgi:GTPase SAR1 family protein
MGSCVFKEEEVDEKIQTKSRRIEKRIEAERSVDNSKLKLLLLGPGDSGKTTLFKQLRELYVEQFSHRDRVNSRMLVHLNVVETMLAMAAAAFKNWYPDIHVSDEVLKAMDDSELKTMDKFQNIDEKLAANFRTIWFDPEMNRMYKEHMNELDIPSSVEYFMDRLDEISEPDYLPIYQDTLYIRSRTTGARKIEFVSDGQEFEIYDVGGQKTERKKWLSHFDKVQSVLFLVPMGDYDQFMFEDKTVNRLQDAMDLFTEVIKNAELKQSSMILFLNKRDLFEKKYPEIPLSNFFHNYKGKTPADAYEFLAEEFNKCNPYEEKEIHVHVTIATDTTNIDLVFQNVRQTVINSSIKELGLL